MIPQRLFLSLVVTLTLAYQVTSQGYSYPVPNRPLQYPGESDVSSEGSTRCQVGRSASSRCRLRQGTFESENRGNDRTWVSHNFVTEDQPSPCAQRRNSKCRARQATVERQNYELAEDTDSEGWRTIPCQVGKSRCRVRVSATPVVDQISNNDLQESESQQYHQIEEQREESQSSYDRRRPSGLACLVLGDRAQGQNGCQLTTSIAENPIPHETHNRQYYVDELGRETETQTMSRAVPCQGRQDGQCRIVSTTTTTTENNVPTGSRTRQYYINERGEVTELETEYSGNSEPAPTQATSYRDDLGQTSRRRIVTTTSQDIIPTESSSRQYYVNEREEVTETESNSRLSSGQAGATPCQVGGRNGQGSSRCRVTTTTTQEIAPTESSSRQYYVNEREEVTESESNSRLSSGQAGATPCQVAGRNGQGSSRCRVTTTTTQEIVPTESTNRQYYVNEREEVTETETNSRQSSGQSGVTPCQVAGSRNDQGQGASRCRVTTTSSQAQEAVPQQSRVTTTTTQTQESTIPQNSRGRQYHINERGEVVESETSSTTTTARRTTPCQVSQPARCQYSQGSQQVTEQRETSTSETRPCRGSGACLVEKLQARLDERRRAAARTTIPTTTTTTTTTTPRPRRTTTVAAAVSSANDGFEERVVHRESAEHHEETYTISGGTRTRTTKSLGPDSYRRGRPRVTYGTPDDNINSDLILDRDRDRNRETTRERTSSRTESRTSSNSNSRGGTGGNRIVEEEVIIRREPSPTPERVVERVVEEQVVQRGSKSTSSASFDSGPAVRRRVVYVDPPAQTVVRRRIIYRRRGDAGSGSSESISNVGGSSSTSTVTRALHSSSSSGGHSSGSQQAGSGANVIRRRIIYTTVPSGISGSRVIERTRYIDRSRNSIESEDKPYYNTGSYRTRYRYGTNSGCQGGSSCGGVSSNSRSSSRTTYVNRGGEYGSQEKDSSDYDEVPETRRRQSSGISRSSAEREELRVNDYDVPPQPTPPPPPPQPPQQQQPYVVQSNPPAYAPQPQVPTPYQYYPQPQQYVPAPSQPTYVAPSQPYVPQPTYVPQTVVTVPTPAYIPPTCNTGGSGGRQVVEEVIYDDRDGNNGVTREEALNQGGNIENIQDVRDRVNNEVVREEVIEERQRFVDGDDGAVVEERFVDNNDGGFTESGSSFTRRRTAFRDDRNRNKIGSGSSNSRYSSTNLNERVVNRGSASTNRDIANKAYGIGSSNDESISASSRRKVLETSFSKDVTAPNYDGASTRTSSSRSSQASGSSRSYSSIPDDEDDSGNVVIRKTTTKITESSGGGERGNSGTQVLEGGTFAASNNDQVINRGRSSSSRSSSSRSSSRSSSSSYGDTAASGSSPQLRHLQVPTNYRQLMTGTPDQVARMTGSTHMFSSALRTRDLRGIPTPESIFRRPLNFEHL